MVKVGHARLDRLLNRKARFGLILTQTGDRERRSYIFVSYLQKYQQNNIRQGSHQTRAKNKLNYSANNE